MKVFKVFLRKIVMLHLFLLKMEHESILDDVERNQKGFCQVEFDLHDVVIVLCAVPSEVNNLGAEFFVCHVPVVVKFNVEVQQGRTDLTDTYIEVLHPHVCIELNRYFSKHTDISNEC